MESPPAISLLSCHAACLLRRDVLARGGGQIGGREAPKSGGTCHRRWSEKRALADFLEDREELCAATNFCYRNDDAATARSLKACNGNRARPVSRAHSGFYGTLTNSRLRTFRCRGCCPQRTEPLRRAQNHLDAGRVRRERTADELNTRPRECPTTTGRNCAPLVGRTSLPCCDRRGSAQFFVDDEPQQLCDGGLRRT